METSWIVFLVGSAVSYLPIYWALSRFARLRETRRNRKSKPRACPDARQEFLDCLRREAIARTDAVLLDAEALWRRRVAGSNSAMAHQQQEILARLGEARRTIQSLFAAEAAAAFDRVIAALQSRPSHSGDAARLLSEFKARLSEQLGADDRSRAFGAFPGLAPQTLADAAA